MVTPTSVLHTNIVCAHFAWTPFVQYIYKMLAGATIFCHNHYTISRAACADSYVRFLDGEGENTMAALSRKASLIAMAKQPPPC